MNHCVHKKTLVGILVVAIALVLPAFAVAQGTVAVAFQGTCIDPEDGDLSGTLVWTSDVQGQVGNGAAGTMQLNEGTHVITATCDDSGPEPAQSASVTITVSIDEAPSVIILQPADGQTFGE